MSDIEMELLRSSKSQIIQLDSLLVLNSIWPNATRLRDIRQ